MKKIFLIYFFAANLCFANIKNVTIPKLRSEPINLKVSVIIPCYHGHFQHLKPLLELYCNQTIIPEEIVISLSEANKVPQTELAYLENHSWPFKLVILKTDTQLFAGANRNNAADIATGELLICQDADDIPHPQRVEIIKYAFENYKIEHLMHYFTQKMEKYSEVYDLNNIFNLNNHKYRSTHGNIALTKELYNKFKWGKWPRGQDVLFNLTVFKSGYPHHVITVPLLFWQKRNSSFRYVNSLRKKLNI